MMRILVLDTYYDPFLREHYGRSPGLRKEPYHVQLGLLFERCFGTSDAFSHYLGRMGVECKEVIVNCVPLQVRWATEHSVGRPPRAVEQLAERFGRRSAHVPWLRGQLHRIVRAQIDAFDPDVVYVQDIAYHTTKQARELGHGRLLVGQIASAAPPVDHLRAFDLVITSFPHFLDRFRSSGVATEYLPLAFDKRMLERLPASTAKCAGDVVFVGGLDPRIHAGGVALLEHVCAALGTRIAVYGYGAERLPASSSILDRYQGEAWGLEMYRALAAGSVALNRHIAAAEGHSNNMRLYETTGVGTALVTDDGVNLSELFEPGEEVETYQTPDGLVEVTLRLLDRECERVSLAAAGQKRTLRDHTYDARMTSLEALLAERLAGRSGRSH